MERCTASTCFLMPDKGLYQAIRSIQLRLSSADLLNKLALGLIQLLKKGQQSSLLKSVFRLTWLDRPEKRLHATRQFMQLDPLLERLRSDSGAI